jgi:hypothetical protein
MLRITIEHNGTTKILEATAIQQAALEDRLADIPGWFSTGPWSENIAHSIGLMAAKALNLNVSPLAGHPVKEGLCLALAESPGYKNAAQIEADKRARGL